MATRIPVAASFIESHATSGVLPVPPTVRLPTTTTGAATFTRCRRPTRYNKLRRVITAPYSQDNGASHTGALRPYHIFSMPERI